MKFGKKIEVSSMPILSTSVDCIYPQSGEMDLNDSVTLMHRKQFENIVTLFRDEISTSEKNFRCFIERKALDAFVAFANEVYQNSRHEATGIIVGYYLHDEQDPNKKVIVGTNFLQATGTASNVTCEFSYQYSIRHSNYCDKYKVLPIIWIHSHPGFGVFYSSTDSSTLKGYFNCDHQMGVVVDNIQNHYLGFKIYNGEQKVEDINIFDIEHCMAQNKLSYTNVSYKKSSKILSDDSSEKKKTVSFKDLSEQHKTQGAQKPISFNALNELTSQLSKIEKSGSFGAFIKNVVTLGQLVDSLKLITSKESSCHFGQFSREDMKKEIESQMQDIISTIQELYKNLTQEYSTFREVIGEISHIKECLLEIKQDTQEQDSITSSLISRVDEISTSIHSLIIQNQTESQAKPVCSSLKSFLRKYWIVILLIFAFICSLSMNIIQFYHEDIKSDKAKKDTVKVVQLNNNVCQVLDKVVDLKNVSAV